MFDRLDIGSRKSHYWLLQSAAGRREMNNEARQLRLDVCLFLATHSYKMPHLKNVAICGFYGQADVDRLRLLPEN